MQTILPAFLKFSNEAAIIARLLAGYAELEIALLHCVHVVREDFDTVLKVLFRIRGETNRIKVADAFGRQSYDAIGLEAEFVSAIAAMRHCLKIRNQYAHCNWWDDNSGRLAFANLEEAAQENTHLRDLATLTTRHVSLALLQSQEDYFAYAADLLRYVNYEGRFRVGRIPSQSATIPPQKSPPPLHIP